MSVHQGGLEIPEVWQTMISKFLETPQTFIHEIEILPREQKEIEDPIAYLIPPVIIWDPLTSLKQFITEKAYCPECLKEEKHSELIQLEWNLGGKSHKKHLRTIHGINNTVLLVTRQYRCKFGHIVSSHNSNIANAFIPFNLSHRSGFTTALSQ